MCSSDLGEAEGEAATKLSAEYDHLQHEMDAKGIWDLDSRVEQAAHALQVPPLDRDVDTLSGGERRRVVVMRGVAGAGRGQRRMCVS